VRAQARRRRRDIRGREPLLQRDLNWPWNLWRWRSWWRWCWRRH